MNQDTRNLAVLVAFLAFGGLFTWSLWHLDLANEAHTQTTQTAYLLGTITGGTIGVLILNTWLPPEEGEGPKDLNANDPLNPAARRKP